MGVLAPRLIGDAAGREHGAVYPSMLTARCRAMWESLTGSPAGFEPLLRVAVSPGSRLGPPGWVGIVVIADAVIASAPTPDIAQAVQQAIGTLPPASLTDPTVLSKRLALMDMLGPASLAYLDPAEFLPHHWLSAVEQLLPHDDDLGQLVAASSAEDVAESGITEITSPAFAVREHGMIISAAGYCDWPSQVAHLSVLTIATARSRGLARTVASAATRHAIADGKLPQWRARPETSRRVARALGFRELGSQVSIRIPLTEARQPAPEGQLPRS
jgi:GNAT acetyltransferase